MRLLLTLLPTLLFVVYGQLVSKWRVQELAAGAAAHSGKMARLVTYITDPFILSAYVAAIAASVAWMFVIERYEVSLAYPLYIGLTVMLVVLGGAFFFGEKMSLLRTASILLIFAGVALGSLSQR